MISCPLERFVIMVAEALQCLVALDAFSFDSLLLLASASVAVLYFTCCCKSDYNPTVPSPTCIVCRC